jgi:hypothetical protein|tara:strand:+ start:1122 stop:1772 length:651 start_codon:yes stop_codon:yes gene_type:complete
VRNVAEKGERKMNKKMLDLFSGLGGASESFLNNGWDVMRIEKNPALALVPNTKILDVYDLGQYLDIMSYEGHVPDQPALVWASPPCTDFSDGFSSPKSQAIRNKEKYDPKEAIEMVIETKRIIDLIQPKYWIIENVRGAIKFLKPILGEPTMIIDSIVLWGRFPAFSMPPHYKHKKHDKATSTNPMRANLRALIPYEVSEACRLSIENTKTLDYWF